VTLQGIRGPSMQPVQLITAHELVLGEIRTALALGRFRAGDSLPRERDLADMLRVSRAVVREAVAVLASEGVLEVRRGRTGGLFVIDRFDNEKGSRALLRENRERLHQVFEFRLVIESAGARYAAERRTRQELDELGDLVTRMQGLVDQLVDAHDSAKVAEFFALDHDFHLGIAHASRNERLAKATLEARVDMFKPVGTVFDHLDPSANHLHEQIFRAIAETDGDQAAHWMTEHITGTRDSVDAWLRPNPRSKRRR